VNARGTEGQGAGALRCGNAVRAMGEGGPQGPLPGPERRHALTDAAADTYGPLPAARPHRTRHGA